MIITKPVLRSRIKVYEDDLYMHLGDQVQVGEFRKGVLDVFKGGNSEQKAEKLKSQQPAKSCYIVNVEDGHAVITKNLHRLFINFKSYIDENEETLKTINHYDVADLCAAINLLEDSCNGLMNKPIDKDKIYQRLIIALKVLKNITKDVWTKVDSDLHRKAIKKSSI